MVLIRALAVASLLLLANVVGPPPAPAHDLPDELTIRLFVKPQPERLDILAQVPLALLEGMALPKRGAGFLDLPRLDEGLQRSAQAVARALMLLEDGQRLTPARATWRISLPSEDQAFADFESARDHILGPPLPDDTNVFWNQGSFDLYLQYPIAAADGSFALVPGAGGLAGQLELFVTYLPPEGAARTYRVHGNHGRLDLDPGRLGAALTFTRLGFDHILEGIDHLLFLLCLVLPFRLQHLWQLLAVVTSFTIAHSITLIMAATGSVPSAPWFPPLVESLIALSIVYMAVENIVCAWRGVASTRQLSRRWLVTGAFGLIHGFGFSFALQQDLQLAGGHLVSALLAFNLGIELGQVAFLALAVPLLTLVLRERGVQRVAVIIGSSFLAHTGWHWLLERAQALQYIPWPDLGPVLPGALITVVVVVLLYRWFGRPALRRLQRRQQRAG